MLFIARYNIIIVLQSDHFLSYYNESSDSNASITALTDGDVAVPSGSVPISPTKKIIFSTTDNNFKVCNYYFFMKITV